MKLHHPWSPRTWLLSLIAVRSEYVSRAMATSRMPTAIGTDSSSWGWRSF